MRKKALRIEKIDVIRQRSQTQTLAQTVQDVIDLCNAFHAKYGKAVKVQTRAERQRAIHKVFKDLVDRTVFKEIDPFELTQEHILALVSVWVQEGLSARTIVTNLSTIRIWCRWVGKGEFVKSADEYVADPRRVKVVRPRPIDKSQSNVVIFDEQLNRIMEYDEHVGHQLLAIRAFGFMVQEAICFKPNQVNQDGVFHSMQGKRERRMIPLDTEDRRQALALLKEFANRNRAYGGIADKSKSEAAKRKRFHFVLGQFWVTLRDNTAASSGRCLRTSSEADFSLSLSKLAEKPIPIERDPRVQSGEEGVSIGKASMPN